MLGFKFCNIGKCFLLQLVVEYLDNTEAESLQENTVTRWYIHGGNMQKPAGTKKTGSRTFGYQNNLILP